MRDDAPVNARLSKTLLQCTSARTRLRQLDNTLCCFPVRRPERPHAPGRFRTSPPGGRLDSKWRSFLVGLDQLAEAAASCSAGGNRAHELRSEGATSAVSLVGDARIRHHVEEIDDRRCRKLQAWELRVHASGRCRCASIATCDTTSRLLRRRRRLVVYEGSVVVLLELSVRQPKHRAA
jgi:hypothetical protein